MTAVVLRRVAQVVAGQSPPSDHVNQERLGLPFLQGNAEFKRVSPSAANWCPSPPKLCQRGDVLISVRAPVGQLNIADQVYGIGRGLAALRPSNGDARFLYYALLEAKDRIEAEATGSTFDAITAQQLAGVSVYHPGLTTQRRIADFLDDQVTRIDNIIQARQEQEHLADEAVARHAHDAVSGVGLQGDRRPSGVSWLGNVPAHWSMTSVHSVFEVVLGKMLDQAKFTGEHQTPYLRNANVQWGRFALDDVKKMDISPDEWSRYTIRRGDLLICEGGQPGRCAIWSGESGAIGFQKSLHRARPRSRLSVEWLATYLEAAYAVGGLTESAEQTTIGHLTGEQLRSLKVPVPPSQDERSLLGQRARARSELLELVASVRQEVRLLSELKRALISAAVSGEFDVSSADGSGVGV